MGVGRETTASQACAGWNTLAYTMGVGRETTATRQPDDWRAAAYTMGVGRETTAWGDKERLLGEAYTMGVGRETTASGRPICTSTKPTRWESVGKPRQNQLDLLAGRARQVVGGKEKQIVNLPQPTPS